jgi:hypothetical protein
MPRSLVVALALLLATRASAQTVFTAATHSTIIGSTEESGGSVPTHVLLVTNQSSVHVVVFGVSLTSCENIRQQCGGRGANIAIPPGARRTVGRIEPRLQDRPFSYRWTFSYRADSSDARVVAALRENGLLAETPAAVRSAPDTQVTMSMAPVLPERPSGTVTSGDVQPSPTTWTPLVASTDVDGIARATSAVAPTRQFLVTNKSPYPIIVYSFNLATCLNVKQMCGRAPIDVRIPGGKQLQIGRVDAQDRTKRYTYDWSYDWKLDTTDARVATALRARGQREGTLGQARNLAIQPEPGPAASGPTVRERLRFRVARESILGSTQVKGGVVQATGACIDPVELAEHERDTTIVGRSEVPPRMSPTSIILPTLPPELRDATKGDVRVLVRWAVDTTGETLPASVRVLESPSGLLSVRICGAVLGAHLSPGRDGNGQAVRTWVQAPLRVTQ